MVNSRGDLSTFNLMSIALFWSNTLKDRLYWEHLMRVFCLQKRISVSCNGFELQRNRAVAVNVVRDSVYKRRYAK